MSLQEPHIPRIRSQWKLPPANQKSRLAVAGSARKRSEPGGLCRHPGPPCDGTGSGRTRPRRRANSTGQSHSCHSENPVELLGCGRTAGRSRTRRQRSAASDACPGELPAPDFPTGGKARGQSKGCTPRACWDWSASGKRGHGEIGISRSLFCQQAQTHAGVQQALERVGVGRQFSASVMASAAPLPADRRFAATPRQT